MHTLFGSPWVPRVSYDPPLMSHGRSDRVQLVASRRPGEPVLIATRVKRCLCALSGRAGSCYGLREMDCPISHTLTPLSGRHLYVLQSAHPVSYLELSNTRQVQHDGLSPPPAVYDYDRAGGARIDSSAVDTQYSRTRTVRLLVSKYRYSIKAVAGKVNLGGGLLPHIYFVVDIYSRTGRVFQNPAGFSS